MTDSQPQAELEVAPKEGAASAAAVAESNGHKPTVEFRGLVLTLPAKLPGSLALQFTNDPEEQPAMVRGFIKSAIGEEQMRSLAIKLDEEEIGFEDVYDILNNEVLEPIFNAYNLDQGKSSASADS